MLTKLGIAIAAASAAAAGVYFFVYLTRWEWNRALVSGVVLLAVEVLVVGAATLARLRKLERAIAEGGTAPARTPDRAVVEHLQRARPPAHRPFAWLDPRRTSGTTSVFVPVLLGAGVVVSALAWLVERVARMVARPGLEVGLAADLDALAYPQALLARDAHRPSAAALLDGPAVR